MDILFVKVNAQNANPVQATAPILTEQLFLKQLKLHQAENST